MNDEQFDEIAKTKSFAFRTRSLLSFEGIKHFHDYRFGHYDDTAFSLADESIPEFATPFTKEVERLDLVPLKPISSSLCESCGSIPVAKMLEQFGYAHLIHDCLSNLRKSAETCELCRMIVPFFSEADEDNFPIKVKLPRPQVLDIEPSESNRPSLRICADPGSTATRMGIPTGFPAFSIRESPLESFLLRMGKSMGLPAFSIRESPLASSLLRMGISMGFSDCSIRESPLASLLLRKWLEDCNTNHKHDVDFDQDKELPTRVLFLGEPESTNELRVWETKGARGRYIALSHRWGEGDELFSTKKSNYEARCKGMKFDQFPKTFQDAIRVTKMLGIQFLWIDSLCIIQKEEEGDDDVDWRHESRRMETVFASAYCTIAATSAQSSRDGFLNHSASDKRSVRLWGSGEFGPFDVYITEDVENFDHDVEKAALNRRAWVFQERALSPRTIHFTAAHIYWECGSVIRSDCLEDIYRRSNWLGDSQFPKGAARLDASLRNSMYQVIFEKYSSLALSQAYDRPIAVSGLQDRLATFYDTQFTHGIAHRFMHKSLLWKRSGSQWMEPIIFPDSSDRVPSWSWMASTGPICYRPLPDKSVCAEVKLCPGGSTFQAWLALILRCSLRPKKDTNYEIRNAMRPLVGWTRFDQKHEVEVECLSCIPLMRCDDPFAWKEFADVSWDEDLLTGNYCFALLVSQRDGAYKRTGVAVIHCRYLQFTEIVSVE